MAAFNGQSLEGVIFDAFSMDTKIIESFNGRLRDECLNSHVFHVFASVAEEQAVLNVLARRLQPGAAP